MFIYLILISLTSFFIYASETTDPACAPADNDVLGDALLLLDGSQSHYDELTDGIILYINAPQRYSLSRLQFKGQAEATVDYPEGERSNVTTTTNEETCMTTILVNIPLGTLIWENMEVYFSTGRRSFYAVTTYITLEETITVKGFTATRTSELPLTFLLYLSVRTQLFPEIVKTEVDEAFEYYIDTKVAVRSASADGTSHVEIEFETGMNQPWEVKDYMLTDHYKMPDRIISGSESLTMLTNECLGDRYEYNRTDGICVDENGLNSNAMYTDILTPDDDICESVCNRLDECKAYDVYPHPAFMVCEVIGPAIPYIVEQGHWTDAETPGYSWVHFYDDGETPVHGDGHQGLAVCYVKGAKTHFCTQTWRLEYDVNHVCGVEARHNLTLFAGLNYGDDLKALSSDIWIFYNPTCARVIDSLTLVGDLNLYPSEEFVFLAPGIVFRLGEYVHGRVNFTDRPISGVTVNRFEFVQNGNIIDAMDPSLGFELEPVDTEGSSYDFRFLLPLDVLAGSIKGLSTSMTIDLTVHFSGMLNVGRRLLVKQDMKDDVKTAAFSSDIFILFKPCKDPLTLVGRIHKEACSGEEGKERVRLCTKDGWEEVKSCTNAVASSHVVSPSVEMAQMDSTVLLFGLAVSGLLFYGAWERKDHVVLLCPRTFRAKEKV